MHSRRANDQPDVRGVVITGGAEHFSAGADLSIFQAIRGDADAVHASRVFQEAFQTIEDSPKPVIAAVAGQVLGGALELAMACHFRLAAEASRFSMPEVKLGINPGAGGTQRLPRLIGLEPALAMLLGGRPIDARQALEWGLIDAICPAEKLLETAVAVAGTLRVPSAVSSALGGRHTECACYLPLRKTTARREKLADTAANQAALARAEREIAAGWPELIAPREILAAVRAGLDECCVITPAQKYVRLSSLTDQTGQAGKPDVLTAGFLAEREAFRRCMATRWTQNKIYVFCASRQTVKIPELQSVAAARITEAGVLGMGTMGAGIAQALIAGGRTDCQSVLHGLRVTACDQSPAALEAGVARIRGSLGRRVAQGKLTAQSADAALARLATTLDGPVAGRRGGGRRGGVRGRCGQAGGDCPAGSDLPGRDDHRQQHVDDQPGRAGRGDAASGAAGGIALLPPGPADAAGGSGPPPDDAGRGGGHGPGVVQGDRQDAGVGGEPRGVRGESGLHPLPCGGLLAAGGRSQPGPHRSGDGRFRLRHGPASVDRHVGT